MNKENVSLETLASLAKRRGFIYQGSEIYGGLAGTWDYGPLGIQLKRNISNLWWKMFVEDREDMYGVDAAILMNHRVWEASGHTGAGFADPMVEDTVTKKRFRADHLLEENNIDPTGMTLEQMDFAFKEHSVKSPEGNPLSDVRQFNMMFKTHVGSTADEGSVSYLRPETAQGMFVNFRNVVDSFYPDLPFGLAQVGKAFRNEISPRDFTFRAREFEQMEIEYFVHPDEWETRFEEWKEEFYKWFAAIGLPAEKIHELEVPAEDRAHYSKRTIDFEFDFPHGKKELYGLAYRTDFDLSNHAQHSGKNMEYQIKGTNDKLVPHCIEPTFGLDRTVLAVLASAYTEDEQNGETRTFLKLPFALAPVKVAVSPLLKNKPELVAKAREVYSLLKKEFGSVMWDDNGNIGKRYRRQDEIGTPFCVTIDFDTLEDDSVTLRSRDTTQQERINIKEVGNRIKDS